MEKKVFCKLLDVVFFYIGTDTGFHVYNEFFKLFLGKLYTTTVGDQEVLFSHHMGMKSQALLTKKLKKFFSSFN